METMQKRQMASILHGIEAQARKNYHNHINQETEQQKTPTSVSPLTDELLTPRAYHYFPSSSCGQLSDGMKTGHDSFQAWTEEVSAWDGTAHLGLPGSQDTG